MVDAVLDELKKATAQESHRNATKILIQSTDKSVLMKFKEKKKMNHDELVYRVDEDIGDVTDSAIKDIKDFAGSIVISKKSVYPSISGNAFVRLRTGTGVVPRLKSNGLRVFVETFHNEFMSQQFDFFSDPTVEIHSFVRAIEIDGIITDFPSTTTRYRSKKKSSLLSYFFNFP